jgi:GPH family glycoside/pentoside/hexuronide:cation symporter
MWLVPPTNEQTLLLIYYTGMYILFDTMFTLTNVPYIALTPEIAPTYDERTSLHSYRMAFSIGLGLVAAIVPLAIVSAIAGPNPSLAERRSAYAAMAVIIGVLSIIPIYITFFAVHENPAYQDLPTPSIRQSFRIAASNKAFLIAAGIYLLTWMPIDLIQFVLVFLLRDYFGLGADGVDLIFALLFGVAVLALPLWVWLSGRWNKNRAYQVGIAFLAVVLVVLSFAQPGQTGLIVVLAILAGIGLSAAHAIPLAMLPDTIEWDELRTANRQEAAYYSVVTLIQKLVGAVTIALTGAILAATGYVEQTTNTNVTQPPEAIAAIRFLVGPLPALLFTCGIVLCAFYPLTRERHARLVRAIEKKRALRKRFAEEASTDD